VWCGACCSVVQGVLCSSACSSILLCVLGVLQCSVVSVAAWCIVCSVCALFECVLQCVAVCIQCVAVCTQCVAVRCSECLFATLQNLSFELSMCGLERRVEFVNIYT